MSMHLVLTVLSTSLLSYTIYIVIYLAAVDDTIGNVTIDSVRKLD